MRAGCPGDPGLGTAGLCVDLSQPLKGSGPGPSAACGPEVGDLASWSLLVLMSEGEAEGKVCPPIGPSDATEAGPRGRGHAQRPREPGVSSQRTTAMIYCAPHMRPEDVKDTQGSESLSPGAGPRPPGRRGRVQSSGCDLCSWRTGRGGSGRAERPRSLAGLVQSPLSPARAVWGSGRA